MKMIGAIVRHIKFGEGIVSRLMKRMEKFIFNSAAKLKSSVFRNVLSNLYR